MKRRRTLRLTAALLSALFSFQTVFAGAPDDVASLQKRVDGAWSETDTTRTRTILGDDGKVLYKRVYDKKTGKVLSEEQAAAALKGEEAAKAKAAKPATKKTPKKKPPQVTWDNRLELQAIVENTTDNTRRSYEELFANQKDGIGIASLDLRRTAPDRLFRLRTRSLGTWNHSTGADLDYRHQDEFRLRAKYSRTEWDFGTVLDPSTLRERFSVDATFARPSLYWNPRVIMAFRGSDTLGDSLRLQGNTDQYFPRDRMGQSFTPAHRDLSFTLLGGHERWDGSLAYAEQISEESTRKFYQRDIDFDSVRDAIDMWKWQQTFSRTVSGRATYRFNDRYSFTAAVTTTSTDNSFDFQSNRREPVNVPVSQSDMVGLHGQNHGWNDGYARIEEYTLDARPSDLWDVQARIERRDLRNNGQGALVLMDALGQRTGMDVSATANRITEGLFDVQAIFKGWRNTRAYAGYRSSERDERDDDSLGTYVLGANGTPAFQASTRALDRYSLLGQTEKLGYLGVRHQFNKQWDLDLRHEGGTTHDDHRGAVGVDRQTLAGSSDKVRQLLSLRAKPAKDMNVVLKLRREGVDHRDIATQDERKSFGLFANWAPTKKKFTVGTGYTRTTAEIDLPTSRFRDESQTLSLNGSYRFDPRWTGLIDLNQTVSGDVTRLDYQVGEFRLRRELNRGHQASIGYSRRFYRNEDLRSEDFINHLFLLSYSLPL